MNENQNGSEFQQELIQPIEQGLSNEQPTPEGKKKKLIVGGIIAVVIVGISIVAATAALGSNPKTTVAKAYANTMTKGFQSASPFEKATGIFEAYTKSKTENYKAAGAITFEGVKADTVDFSPEERLALEQIKGVGISYDIKKDRSNKQLESSLGILMGSAKVGNIDLYGDAQELYMAVPKLYSGNISIPLQNIGSAYKNSALAQNINLSIPEEYSISLFEQNMSMKTFYKDLMIRYTTANEELLSKVYEGLEVSKTDKKEVTVGDKVQNCKGYTITISDEILDELVESYCDFLKQDEGRKEQTKKMASTVFAQRYSSNFRYGYTDTLEQVETELENNFQTVIDELKTANLKNVVLNCYIDQQNVIRSFDVNYTLDDTNGFVLDTTVKGNFTGTEGIFDTMNLDFIAADETDNIHITYENKSGNDAESGSIIKNTKLVIGDETETILEGILDAKYDTAEGNYTVNLDLNIEKEKISLNSKGKIDIIEKGTGFSIAIDEINIKNNIEDASILLSGRYELNKLTEAIEKPSGVIRPLFEMQQNELIGLTMEIYGNIWKMGNELFGPLY